MPIVEFVWWTGTDEFLAGLDDNFKPMIDYVSNADGCLGSFTGLEVEDKTSFWMTVVWESHEHHKALMSRSDYPDVVAKLQSFFRDGQLKMNHVEFKGDIELAFSAPVTSLSFMTLKAGHTKDELETRIQAQAISGSSWGQTFEDANLFVSITGLASSEIRGDVDESQPLQELSDVADIRTLLVRLK